MIMNINKAGTRMDSQKGFNLIELMVVVAIIGIISTIAVPAYQKNVAKSARGEGMTETLDVMRAQENFFANNFTYTTNLTQLNYSNPHVTANGRYQISAETCTDSDGNAMPLTQCILLTSTAIGGQVDDGNLTLDSQGNRTHGNNSSWIK